MTKLVECMLSYLIHGSILPKKSLFIAHTTTVEIQTYYRKDLTFICFFFSEQVLLSNDSLHSETNS